jgi:hypothetical protein
LLQCHFAKYFASKPALSKLKPKNKNCIKQLKHKFSVYSFSSIKQHKFENLHISIRQVSELTPTNACCRCLKVLFDYLSNTFLKIQGIQLTLEKAPWVQDPQTKKKEQYVVAVA